MTKTLVYSSLVSMCWKPVTNCQRKLTKSPITNCQRKTHKIKLQLLQLHYAVNFRFPLL